MEELEEHKNQLRNVLKQLETDAENEELLSLKSELEEIIELEESIIKEEVDSWKVGDRCRARWNEDGKVFFFEIEGSFIYEI